MLGLKIKCWIIKVNDSIKYFKNVSSHNEKGDPPPMGIHFLMVGNTKEKIQNYVRNLNKNRVIVVIGLVYKQ